MAFRSRQQQELARKPLSTNNARLNIDGPLSKYGGGRGSGVGGGGGGGGVPLKQKIEPSSSISRTLSGSAPLFAMHQENYFDENDGLDDQDFLDLDLDEFTKPAVKAPSNVEISKQTASTSPPTLHEHKVQRDPPLGMSSSSVLPSPPPAAWNRPPPPPPVRKSPVQGPTTLAEPPSSQVPSSIPIPWSSSPPQQPTRLFHSSSKTSTSSTSPATATASTVTEQIPDIDSRPQTKKRTLPWPKNDQPEDMPAPDKPSRSRSSSGFTRKDSSSSEAPKKKARTSSSKSEYPWEKHPSASQLDEREFKEIRKQQKRAGGRAITEAKKSEKSSDNSRAAAIPGIFLSEEQQRILDIIVKNGRSVFFTGSAGTGKSVLMREAIRQLKFKYRHELERVAVTASTGLAACNIGGMTLHSFAGAGLAKEPIKQLVKKIRGNPKAKNRWQRVKVLVIDEISMVDGELFDKLEQVARELRNNGRPFGGIQLVITGDFFQLPPVPDNTPNGMGRSVKFAFDANTWNTCIEHTILLTQVFRQKDPEFAAMLNSLRLGQMTPEINRAFQNLARDLPKDAIEATELFAKRNEVDNANGARLHRLTGEVHNFKAVDSGKDKERVPQLLQSCMAPPEIRLKKGAQVMLIKNLDDTLVNGSLGRVVDFMDSSAFEDWKTGAGKYDRGATLQEVKNYKQLMNGMSTPGFLPTDEMMSGKANSPHATPGRKWPLVCFVQPDGTERHLLCQPEDWKVELPNGEVEAQRLQIPLILAWALSIHKAQGQTLQRVKVDLGKVFEKGQAYVALSRAVSKDGLQVKGWNPNRVMVHPDVVDFYNRLSTANDIQISRRKKVKLDQFIASAPPPPPPPPRATVPPPAPTPASIPAHVSVSSSKPAALPEKSHTSSRSIDAPTSPTHGSSKSYTISRTTSSAPVVRQPPSLPPSRPPPEVISLIDDDDEEEALAEYMP